MLDQRFKTLVVNLMPSVTLELKGLGIEVCTDNKLSHNSVFPKE